MEHIIPIRIELRVKKFYNIFLQMAGKSLFLHQLYNLPFGAQDIIIKNNKKIVNQKFILFWIFLKIFLKKVEHLDFKLT